MHWIDPEALPESTGTVNAVVYNAGGEIDGLVLDGDRLVHVPPWLAVALGPRRLRPGSRIAVRWIKPRNARLWVAVAITADGRCVVDDGPDDHDPPPAPATQPMDIVGQVRLTLHAPQGEVCGALLEDGSIARVHPRHNEALAEYFEPGRRIEVWGPGFRKGGVRVVDVDHVALIAHSEDEAARLAGE